MSTPRQDPAPRNRQDHLEDALLYQLVADDLETFLGHVRDVIPCAVMRLLWVAIGVVGSCPLFSCSSSEHARPLAQETVLGGAGGTDSVDAASMGMAGNVPLGGGGRLQRRHDAGVPHPDDASIRDAAPDVAVAPVDSGPCTLEPAWRYDDARSCFEFSTIPVCASQLVPDAAFAASTCVASPANVVYMISVATKVDYFLPPGWTHESQPGDPTSTYTLTTDQQVICQSLNGVRDPQFGFLPICDADCGTIMQRIAATFPLYCANFQDCTVRPMPCFKPHHCAIAADRSVLLATTTALAAELLRCTRDADSCKNDCANGAESPSCAAGACFFGLQP